MTQTYHRFPVIFTETDLLKDVQPSPPLQRPVPRSRRRGQEQLWTTHLPANPLVLHAGLFPPADSTVHHFQCDCACPDDGFVLRPRNALPATANLPLRHPRLHSQRLADNYFLLFNPLHNQGVTVLNPAAHEIWQRFATPRRAVDIATGEEDVSTLTIINDLIDCGLLEAMDVNYQPRQGPLQTLSAWLHVTNACNLRCDYCYIDKSNEEMSAEVSRAAVDAIFRSAAVNGFRQVKLKFAGGEALLNWQRVSEMNAYARQCSQQTGIEVESVLLSNGVFINDEVIDACRNKQMRISISLDGIGPMHDAQRRFANGRGSFAWVDRTIERLITSGVYPFLSITLTNRNAEGLAETVVYALERQLPFNINFFRDNECATPYHDLQLQDERIIDAILRAFAVIEEHLPEQSLLGYLVDRAQFNAPHNRTCSAGHSYLVIDHKGNIAKCQMEIEQPITNIFATDPLALLRGASEGVQNLPVEEKEGCTECEWRYWCAGGCPIATYRATGRYDIKSPNCNIYKAIYPEALRLEGLRLLKLADRFRQLL